MASDYIIAQASLPAYVSGDHNTLWTADADSNCTMCFCNTTNATINLYLAVVPSGTAASAAKFMLKQFPLDANMPFETAAKLIGTGDFILADASAVGIDCTVLRARA